MLRLFLIIRAPAFPIWSFVVPSVGRFASPLLFLCWLRRLESRLVRAQGLFHGLLGIESDHARSFVSTSSDGKSRTKIGRRTYIRRLQDSAAAFRGYRSSWRGRSKLQYLYRRRRSPCSVTWRTFAALARSTSEG